MCYGTQWYSAKELTVHPKRSVTIKDGAAYGIIVTQGYGRFGSLPISTPSNFVPSTSAALTSTRSLISLRTAAASPFLTAARTCSKSAVT